MSQQKNHQYFLTLRRLSYKAGCMLLAFLLTSCFVFAGTGLLRDVKGKVLDAKGDPLGGVSVIALGYGVWEWRRELMVGVRKVVAVIAQRH